MATIAEKLNELCDKINTTSDAGQELEARVAALEALVSSPSDELIVTLNFDNTSETWTVNPPLGVTFSDIYAAIGTTGVKFTVTGISVINSAPSTLLCGDMIDGNELILFIMPMLDPSGFTFAVVTWDGTTVDSVFYEALVPASNGNPTSNEPA